MTNPDLALRTVPDDKLEDLCRLLSREVYQPSAIQILYFLLQPAVQHNVQEWSQLGKAIRRSHRHDLQIWTFGIPPDLSSATSSESQKTGQENVWGVAILPTDENFGEARARFWISTEINATMFDKLDQPRWQPDEQSLAVLKTMCRAVFSSFLQRTGGKSIFFNGINQCWTKHLFALGNNTYDGLCSKAVRKFDLHAEIRVECPVGYRIRALEEKDIETVINSNKIKFRAEYARSRLHLSVAVVNAETDELASWAFAHADFSIGALHTAPAYRKKGLGAIVVAELGNRLREALSRNSLASAVMKDAFYVHADTEAWNVTAIKWFCSLGYQTCIANTWTRIEVE